MITSTRDQRLIEFLAAEAYPISRDELLSPCKRYGTVEACVSDKLWRSKHHSDLLFSIIVEEGVETLFAVIETPNFTYSDQQKWPSERSRDGDHHLVMHAAREHVKVSDWQHRFVDTLDWEVGDRKDTYETETEYGEFGIGHGTGVGSYTYRELYTTNRYVDPSVVMVLPE